MDKNELLGVLYLPFRILGTSELSLSEYIHTFSLRLNKATPSQTKIMLSLALKCNILELKDKVIRPTMTSAHSLDSQFYIDDAIDFLKKEINKPPLIKIAEVISDALGLTLKDVIARVNEKQKELNYLLSPEIVALEIAQDEKIDITTLKKLIHSSK